MRRVLMVLVLAGVAGGCGDALTSRVEVAARANGYELGVERLAELIATGKNLPIRRDVAEGIAVLWVDYTLFADGMLAGQTFIDSAHVVAAMWAEIQQEYADLYHRRLMGDRIDMDSAAVDSVYAAGNYRFIKHILFRIEPNTPADIRAGKRRLANETHRRLGLGLITWAEAAQLNEDPGSVDLEGALGVIEHGETTAEFENAAWELQPGGISPVVESPYGYHIITRPPLDEVREEFRAGVQRRTEDTFDEEFLAELPERWDFDVRSGIAPAVREVGMDPMRAKHSGKVLGTYRGGRFRVSDLARWLQGMPVQVRQQLTNASEAQITQLVTGLMRNQVLVEEARAEGLEISPAFMAEITEQLRRQLALVSALLGFPLDTLPALQGLPEEARRDSVRVRVYEYMLAIAQEKKRLQAVPPFLADAIRDESDWELVPAGIERVLGRARELRAALDTLPQPQQGGEQMMPTMPMPMPGPGGQVPPPNAR